VLTLAEEKNTVRTTLTNMEAGSAEFRRAMVDNRNDLRDAIAHLRTAAEASRRIAEASEPRVAGALDDVRSAATRVDGMAARMDSLALVLTRVADKLDQGSGTAAKLMNDRKLYDETQATMTELRALVHDLRTNPNKYFKVSVF
jgi:phospholipid/cholesterol/gamma-HCH transport system substrate-binding protein